MKNELIKNAELLLAKAEGLPEPHYDLSMKKSNWPDSMNTMLEEFVHSLCTVGAGTKGDGCEFKRGQVICRWYLSLGYQGTTVGLTCGY
jgi:hypothetical protein